MKQNRQQILIGEFKNSLKNRTFLPYKDEKYGTVKKGVINSTHVYFYAILRMSNVDNAFHNIHHFKKDLNIINSSVTDVGNNYAINLLKKVFPSITKEDVLFYTQHYINQNKLKGI